MEVRMKLMSIFGDDDKINGIVDGLLLLREDPWPIADHIEEMVLDDGCGEMLLDELGKDFNNIRIYHY